MRRWIRLSAAAAVVLAACAEPTSAPQQQAQSATQTQQPEFTPANPVFAALIASPGEHVHILPTRTAFATILNTDALTPFARGGSHGGGGGGGGKNSSGTGINYHGGPIVATPKIAAIYWASSAIYSGGPTSGSGSGSGDGSNVGLFMRSLGGSGYWNINSTYYDGSGQSVTNALDYTSYWADNTNAPASGARVSDAAVQAEVESAFTGGHLSYDPSTLYAVFSGPGVNLGGGAGTSYCAYHGYFTDASGRNVKYAVLPYAVTYGGACSISGAAPTSDAAAAAEVNLLAHETEETMTDENLNAWYDHRGYENADKCAWNFGSTSSNSTGQYNQTLGGTNWLIQMNWVNANSGGCLQTWP